MILTQRGGIANSQVSSSIHGFVCVSIGNCPLCLQLESAQLWWLSMKLKATGHSPHSAEHTISSQPHAEQTAGVSSN